MLIRGLRLCYVISLGHKLPTSKQAVRGDMDLRNVKNKKHFSIVSPVAFGVYVYEVRK